MLAAGFAPAQDQPDPGAREQQEPTYEAPSVLSRSSGLLEATGKPFEFGMFTKVSTVYDSGLIPVGGPSFETPLAPQGAFGLEASFGAAVSRRWSRAKLTVEYRGVYRQYTTLSWFNGLDQFFQMAYSRLMERHLVLDLRNTLGTTTLANGEFAYLPVSNLDRIGLPANDLFDNRTNYLESRVDLTWQESVGCRLVLAATGSLSAGNRRCSPDWTDIAGGRASLTDHTPANDFSHLQQHLLRFSTRVRKFAAANSDARYTRPMSRAIGISARGRELPV